MSAVQFKITIHMVSSLDGIIAKTDNSISWLETVSNYDKGVETTKEEMDEFLKTIDCYLMGARTYEHAVELSKSYGWAYGDVPTIVVTRRNLPINRPNIEVYAGDLNKLVNEQLRPKYNNVWLVGGPMLAKAFIDLKLVDEIRLAIIPILLGDGTRFIDGLEEEQILHLKDVITYKNGMVELCYEVRR